jgi:hypothetical protein
VSLSILDTVVLIETLGCCSPYTTAGRYVTMAIIGFAVIYVPTVTSIVLEIMSLESKYQRNSFASALNGKHVVICGDLASISLKEFFDELFHEDHSNTEDQGNILQIVVLQPSKCIIVRLLGISCSYGDYVALVDPPTAEMATLLMNPVYSIRITYIEGSALNEKALHKASVHNAAAVFVMANKFAIRADEEDAKTVLQALSVRKFIERSSADVVAKYHLQIIKSENCRLVPANNTKNKSVVVCMNDVKMGLMAKATVYPGTNTFILNLITSIAYRAGDADSDQDQRWHRELNRRALMLGHRHSIYSVAAGADNAANTNANTPTASVLPNNHRQNDWLTEYSAGCNWELYCVPLSHVFEGSKFVETSFIVAQRTNILLIGLYITDLSCGLSKVLLNPATFVIPMGDKFEVSAIVMAKNKQNAMQLSQLCDTDTVFYANAFRHHKTEVRRTALDEDHLHLPHNPHNPQSHPPLTGPANRPPNNQRSADISTSVTPPASALGYRAISQKNFGRTKEVNVPSFPAVDSGTATEVHPLERVSLVNLGSIAETMAKVPENFIKLELSALKQRTHVLDASRDIDDFIVPGSIIDWFPNLTNHIVIMGKNLSNVHDLIKPLRARYLGPIRPIVILHPYDIVDAVWNQISRFPDVYIVKGSSLNEVDIMRAGIFRAQQVVVLADACSHELASLSTSATTISQMESLVDSDALFTYQCVKRLVPHVHIVMELFQQQNIPYLELSSLNLPFQNSSVSKPFAAGSLFTTYMLDSLVCQTFYNPVHIKIVEKLISGVDSIDRDALLVDAIADEMNILGTERKDVLNVKNSILNTAKESCLYLIDVPEQCHRKPYRALFEVLAKTNVIPLGLLRGNVNTDSADGVNAATRLDSGRLSPTMTASIAAHSSDAYVYTNPSRNTIVTEIDKVFVLSPLPFAPAKEVSRVRLEWMPVYFANTVI